MARYVNIWREKSIVVRKAYDGDFSRWISEHEYIVAIETDDGRLLQFPVMASDYLRDYTADEYLKEMEDEDVRVLMQEDCRARDCDIKQNLTEWICNECCVSGGTVIDAICEVVSLLTRYGMWKDMYSKSIDMKKIREECGDE